VVKLTTFDTKKVGRYLKQKQKAIQYQW